MSKLDWATKAVQKYHASVLYFVSCGVSEDLVLRSDNAVKLLRQRDAMWKRAVKRLKSNCDDTYGLYTTALDDLLAIMNEKRQM